MKSIEWSDPEIKALIRLCSAALHENDTNMGYAGTQQACDEVDRSTSIITRCLEKLEGDVPKKSNTLDEDTGG